MKARVRAGLADFAFHFVRRQAYQYFCSLIAIPIIGEVKASIPNQSAGVVTSLKFSFVAESFPPAARPTRIPTPTIPSKMNSMPIASRQFCRSEASDRRGLKGSAQSVVALTCDSCHRLVGTRTRWCG